MKSSLYKNVVYFPQFIQPNEGEPMDSYIQKYKVQGGYKLKSNILWPEKDPKTGKTIRRHIGIKLDCWEHEKMKA